MNIISMNLKAYTLTFMPVFYIFHLASDFSGYGQN